MEYKMRYKYNWIKLKTVDKKWYTCGWETKWSNDESMIKGRKSSTFKIITA